ncbi:MAG: hypothetical protein QM619_07585 [Micropruina sp.]|uniref:hypothetical protein n=1 Tax=Micropruina sp. TaxID=2737536 RepID=UPI0039E4D365
MVGGTRGALAAFAAVWIFALAACGGLGARVGGWADDVARAAAASRDDVERVASWEASRTGRSADEVGRGWLAKPVLNAQTLRTRYESIPAGARGAACDLVGSILSDILAKKESLGWGMVTKNAIQAVAGMNPTAGQRALAEDLRAAVDKAVNGNPDVLALLVAKTAACSLA